MNNGRQATKGTGLKKSLTPSVSNGSTFVRPQGPRTGPSGLAQIADALGSLAPALSTAMRKQKEAEDKFITVQSAKSPQEFRRAVANDPRLQVEAGYTVLGQKEASVYQGELAKAIQEFNPDGDQDIHSFLAEKRTGWMENLGDNNVVKASFVKATDKMHQGVIAGYQKNRAEKVGRDIDTGIVFQLRNNVADAQGDPKKINKAITETLTTNKQILGLPKQRQSALLYQFAEEEAQNGNPALVEAILKNNRGGSAPALLDDPQYRKKAIALIEAAHTQSSQNYKLRKPDVQSEAEALVDEGVFDADTFKQKYPDVPQSELTKYRLRSEKQARILAAVSRKAAAKATLKAGHERATVDATADALERLEQGGTAALDTVTIANKTDGAQDHEITVKKLTTLALNEYERRGDLMEEQLRRVMPEEEARARRIDAEIRFFSKAPDVTNRKWESQLKNLDVSGAASVIVNTGEVPQRVQDAVDLYEKLRSTAPGLIRTHTSGDDAQFLDVYYALRFSGSDQKDALVKASQWRSRKDNRALPLLKPLDDAKLRSQLTEHLDDGFFFDSLDINSFDMATLKKQINIYQETGLDQDAAIKAAGNWLAGTHTVINRTPVWTGSATIPEDTPEVTETFFKDLVEKHGENLLINDPDSLTLRPVNRDSDEGWIVMEKDGVGLMRPVRARDGRFVMLTPNDIKRIKARVIRDDNLKLEWQRRVHSRNSRRQGNGPSEAQFP